MSNFILHMHFYLEWVNIPENELRNLSKTILYRTNEAPSKNGLKDKFGWVGLCSVMKG
jgi:hypothetical protein